MVEFSRNRTRNQEGRSTSRNKRQFFILDLTATLEQFVEYDKGKVPLVVYGKCWSD